MPPKQARSHPAFLGTQSAPRPREAGAAGRGAGSQVGAPHPRGAPPAGRASPSAGGPPGSAPGSGWERAPGRGACPPAPTHRRCVWFSAASWGCREEAAEETRSGAPPPGHHTRGASRPGPWPPPPGAVPAPAPRGEPPQPPTRSAARPGRRLSAPRSRLGLPLPSGATAGPLAPQPPLSPGPTS